MDYVIVNYLPVYLVQQTINKTIFNLKLLFFSSIPKPLNLTGPLEVNNLLDNAERLFEGQVHGPETLIKRGNEIYTGIHGGEVIKITGDHITHVAKFGKPCGKLIYFIITFQTYKTI